MSGKSSSSRSSSSFSSSSSSVKSSLSSASGSSLSLLIAVNPETLTLAAYLALAALVRAAAALAALFFAYCSLRPIGLGLGAASGVAETLLFFFVGYSRSTGAATRLRFACKALVDGRGAVGCFSGIAIVGDALAFFFLPFYTGTATSSSTTASAPRGDATADLRAETAP